MKSADILKALEGYYKPYYFVPNIYFFNPPYTETDALIVKENGFLYDIEIKVTKSDFFADFKKDKKHSILKNGYYKTKRGKHIGKKRYKAGQNIPQKDRPNRFFYAVPEKLISVKDLPDYAGLLYICNNGKIKKVKEGKLLHNKKINYNKRLCRKFYFYWRKLKYNKVK